VPFPTRARGAVLAAALALLGGLLAGVAAPATARVAGDTLYPSQGNPGYDVQSYRVRLDYRPATNRIDAVTTIRARASEPRSGFHLDLEGLRVTSVRVDGEAARWRREGHELIVRPRHEVSGSFTARVAYDGVPRTHADPDGSAEGWVRTSDGATALGEPVGTMTWIPSDNTPGDKARFTYLVTVPTGYQVAANGNLRRKSRHDRHTTWTWHSRDRMSTYLAMLAIGHFDVHRSSTTSVTGRRIPTWSFTDPTTGPADDLRRLLPEVIRFEEKRFGPYPFTSTGFVIDNASVGYALETQTRPFFPFGASTLTLVHELAHQWYGDSVTLRDWHDIWLAEGFATYAEWLWSAAHGGATPAQRFANLYATPADDELWHPAPTGFTDKADLFGTPVYTRGAMTLQALRAEVGSPAFFTILRTWAAEHRQGNVRTAQLVALAERVSGEDLGPLFADWLELDGRPDGY
jgi:aminopeptidase N